MLVALLTNTAWLDEELHTFRALLVGLLDEGIGAVKVVPETISPEELGMMGQRVTWRETRWPLIKERRLAALGSRLTELEVDMIHAVDGRLWRAARKLAETLDLPVIYQANSYMDLRLVEQVLRNTTAPKLAFTATTQPIASAIRQIAGDDVDVYLIPPGVHGAGDRPRTRDPNQSLCAIISGNDKLDGHYMALLNGLVAFVHESPTGGQSLFFFDSQSENQHQIWRAANRAGLGPNLSMVPRRLGHREMLLKADLLIHPQPQGKSRTLTLQAMGHGLPVLAAADPWLDYLIDGQTAWLIEPTPEAYRDKLMDIVANPHKGRALGESAQQWIKEGRLASDMIDRTLSVYRAVSGEAIEFPG